MESESGSNQPVSTWDHSSHERFYEYYSKASQSEETLQRFRSIRDCVLRVIKRGEEPKSILEVADIGCGAGTQCLVWAELGHRIHGIEVNGPLVELARERASQAGYAIDFRIGSAVELPWADESMDVCVALELLEHVADWKGCLNEYARVLRPGGVLFMSTSNKLCPVQHEFNLPLYSWYPGRIKRHFERLSVTTRPDLANYAKYPAVNWFSFYSLRAVLAAHGFRSFDRFDVTDLSTKGMLAKFVLSCFQAIPLLRWLGHVASPGTIVVAVKRT